MGYSHDRAKRNTPNVAVKGNNLWQDFFLFFFCSRETIGGSLNYVSEEKPCSKVFARRHFLYLCESPFLIIDSIQLIENQGMLGSACMDQLVFTQNALFYRRWIVVMSIFFLISSLSYIISCINLQYLRIMLEWY